MTIKMIDGLKTVGSKISIKLNIFPLVIDILRIYIKLSCEFSLYDFVFLENHMVTYLKTKNFVYRRVPNYLA